MRKLASIQKIMDLQPIEGADQIEVAQILGWHVVVKKGDFKVDDLCVYCEIDSILPECPEFEFLRPRKFRIKTVRLRGQVSQGIAFPIDILSGKKFSSDSRESFVYDWIEGQEVTELLQIRKWEPEIPAVTSGIAKGLFPSFIPKTDQSRIQSEPGVLTRPEHQERLFVVTEKVDGTSGTFYWKDGIFGVCSRNLEMKETDNNCYWQAARNLDLESKLRNLNRNIAIQGEVISPGVQKNRYKVKQAELLVFDIFLIDESRYANFDEFSDIANQLNLRIVPLIDDNFKLQHTDVDSLVVYSQGVSQLNAEMPREGVVIKSKVEARDPDLGRLSFKVVNPEFLLKYE